MSSAPNRKSPTKTTMSDLENAPLVEVFSRGVATYPPGATFGPRRLREWEFVWMIESDAVYARAQDSHAARVPAPAGSVLLCRPSDEPAGEVVDSFVWDARHRTRHAYFHFGLRHLPGADWPTLSAWPVVRAASPDDLLLTLFRHVLTPHDDALSRDLAATLLLRSFVTGQGAMSQVPPDAPPEPVSRALTFLYAHLDADAQTPVTLQMLARAACVSPEHLCRTFKTATGHSPLETVRLARLDRAATLLARSNFSIGEVGRLCGFSSPFHFARAFRDAFGMTPREARTRVAQGELPPMPRLLRVWPQEKS